MASWIDQQLVVISRIGCDSECVSDKGIIQNEIFDGNKLKSEKTQKHKWVIKLITSDPYKQMTSRSKPRSRCMFWSQGI